jgi:hypothetical protein
MKSSLKLLCKCGYVITLDTIGTQRFKHPNCPECGIGIYLVDDSVVGTRVFNRSRKELESGDFTLAIILTAMAIECELARLFMHWKEVELMSERTATQNDSNEWEAEFRGWGSILARLDKVCHFVTNQDFDSFVSTDPQLSALLTERHPESLTVGSPKKFFQEHLFWKRNQVVHFGKIDFTSSEAEQCVHIASTLFGILRQMDISKVKQFSETH